jgi:hypothetical protein
LESDDGRPDSNAGLVRTSPARFGVRAKPHDGTALAGTNYSGTRRFAAWAVLATVTVDLSDATLTNGDENFTLSLTVSPTR